MKQNENGSISKVPLDSISFKEVRVFPSSERFYQMYRNNHPTPYVYSESTLGDCLNCYEMKFGLK